MDRRSFLKYGALGAAVAGSALAGYEFSEWQASLVPPSVSTITKTRTQVAMETLTRTVTVTAGTLELEVFADWHGDGARQNDEPLIKDAIFQVGGEGREGTVGADGSGKYVLEGIIDGGRYRLDFAKEFLDSSPYRFLSLPHGSFQPIADAYEFVADLTKPTVSLGLMHGFLTLPFPKGTVQREPPCFVDIDPSDNKWEDWQGRTEGTYNGHTGTDFIIPAGTKILAAAPGQVVDVGTDRVYGGDWVEIKHVQGYSTLYHHLKTTYVSFHEQFARGEPIGLSGFSILCKNPSGSTRACHADHLHFEVDRNGRYVDPYRSHVPNKGSSESLWTKENTPQYPVT